MGTRGRDTSVPGTWTWLFGVLDFNLKDMHTLPWNWWEFNLPYPGLAGVAVSQPITQFLPATPSWSKYTQLSL